MPTAYRKRIVRISKCQAAVHERFIKCKARRQGLCNVPAMQQHRGIRLQQVVGGVLADAVCAARDEHNLARHICRCSHGYASRSTASGPAAQEARGLGCSCCQGASSRLKALHMQLSTARTFRWPYTRVLESLCAHEHVVWPLAPWTAEQAVARHDQSDGSAVRASQRWTPSANGQHSTLTVHAATSQRRKQLGMKRPGSRAGRAF